MKKMAAVLVALVLMMGIVMAEVTPFSLGGVYSWGMNESEILAGLGSVRVEKEQERKLTYLEPENYKYVFEGLNSEITFGIAGDQLVLIELDFDDRVSSGAVKDALTALYGKSTEIQDLKELEDLSDADEIDLRDDDPLVYAMWTAEDGTRILMITDTKEDDAKVIFYTIR